MPSERTMWDRLKEDFENEVLCQKGKHIRTPTNTRIYASNTKRDGKVYFGHVVWCLDCHNEKRQIKRNQAKMKALSCQAS